VVLLILPAAAVVGIITFAVIGENGLIRRHRMLVELARTERRLAAVEEQNLLLRRQVDQLANDPVTQRRAVAEELLLVPAGSTVYRFEPAP
jgi:cell division protein FtsB